MLFDPSLVSRLSSLPPPIPSQCQDAHAAKLYARHQEPCRFFWHDVKEICVHQRSKEIGHPGPQRLAAAIGQCLARDQNDVWHPRSGSRGTEPRLPMPCDDPHFLNSDLPSWNGFKRFGARRELAGNWKRTAGFPRRPASCRFGPVQILVVEAYDLVYYRVCVTIRFGAH